MGTRVIAPVHVAFRTYLLRRRPGCKFSQLNSPPRLYPCLRFTESLAVSAQDSGPSGSLVLSRKNFAFSASCRFSPAHQHRDHTQNPLGRANRRHKLVNRLIASVENLRSAAERGKSFHHIVEATAASCTPLSLLSGWGCR